ESEPSGARVTLVRGDERRTIGETPTTANVDISGGQWAVEMERRGHEPWSAPLSPPSSQAEHTVRAELQEEERVARHDGPRRVPERVRGGGDTPRRSESASSGAPGTLRVNTTPWSQVYVDGRLIG